MFMTTQANFSFYHVTNKSSSSYTTPKRIRALFKVLWWRIKNFNIVLAVTLRKELHKIQFKVMYFFLLPQMNLKAIRFNFEKNVCHLAYTTRHCGNSLRKHF